MALRHRLMQRVKNTAYLGLGITGQLTLQGVRHRDGAQVLRILMYHKVSPHADNPPCVPPSLFREQMEHVRACANPVSVDDYLAARRGERPLPPRSVLVTFDDGYRDTLEHAAPILSALGIPAVLFTPTSYIGATRPLPHDEGLARAGVDNPTLDWDGVRALLDHGFEIGSHGETHRVFSELPPDEAGTEIRRSKALLEERIGRRVRCFAFVKGAPDSFTRETVRQVAEAGYQLGFSSLPGPVHLHDPPLTLRRYNVEPFPVYTFARMVAGDCDLIVLKDSRPGIAGKRWLNEILGTAVK
jgi:peptidoglycan/xylan/chitin deacetylase (PgdA/CDA1 family)